MASILAFAGSSRKGSFNKMALDVAVQGARQSGADVTVLDLGDYPLPLYDANLEAEKGIPENALRLKELFTSKDSLLIASPEYNSSISPLLKNTIDWVSRPLPKEKPLAAFRGKSAALLSASPGGFGGLRGLVTVRSLLGNIGVLVLPDQVAVPKADTVFAADGTCRDTHVLESLQNLGRTLSATAGRLSGESS